MMEVVYFIKTALHQSEKWCILSPATNKYQREVEQEKLENNISTWVRED